MNWSIRNLTVTFMVMNLIMVKFVVILGCMLWVWSWYMVIWSRVMVIWSRLIVIWSRLMVIWSRLMVIWSRVMVVYGRCTRERVKMEGLWTIVIRGRPTLMKFMMVKFLVI